MRIMLNNIRAVRQLLGEAGVPFYENEPMSGHTSFEIGGPAALYCVPGTQVQLSAALAAAQRHDICYILLGNGSNLVFPDEGYPGVVIRYMAGNIGPENKKNRLAADAGASLAALCEQAQAAGLSGLEFAYGIPGSVGGAVYMNAGAFDGEIARILHSVTLLDETLKPKTLPVHSLGFGYRTSAFHNRPWYILKACFNLHSEKPDKIEKIMQENIKKRASRQPLDLPSGGSAFKRPNGAFAAELIDRSGLRGCRIGNAAISDKHCGFIVNLGGASCADVKCLVEHVQTAVFQKTGYRLEKEISFVEAGQ